MVGDIERDRRDRDRGRVSERVGGIESERERVVGGIEKDGEGERVVER